MKLGLFRRRECVVPTLRGWVALVFFLGGAGAIFLFGTYPFLALNDPKPGGVLVVEGWGSEDSMRAVIHEFRSNHYQAIYSVGGPIEESSPLAPYGTIAEYGAAVLIRLGCDAKTVHAVPTPLVVKDRTYAAAVALRQLLKEQGIPTVTVNVYSSGAHARRSRLLFEKAFGDGAQIGVVTCVDREFDPRRWWASSIGFRNVTGEVIAYCYARFLFRPSAE